MAKIKISNAIPGDEPEIILLLKETWLSTYPNKKHNITETFKKPAITALDNTKNGQIKKFLYSSALYISTYFVEIAMPTAIAVLTPTGAIISALRFGTFVGLAGVNIGIGSFFRKIYEDQKMQLNTEIAKAKLREDIPNYKNINELKEIIKQQEQKLQISSDKWSLKPQSGLQQYWQGLKDVINPFTNPLEVKDSKVFARIVSGAAISSAAITGIISGMPEIAISGITTAIGASAATIVMENINSNHQIEPKTTSESVAQEKSFAHPLGPEKASNYINKVQKHSSYRDAIEKNKLNNQTQTRSAQ